VASFSWYSGALGNTVDQIKTGIFRATANAGLAVHSLHVEGRGRTPMPEVMAALDVKKNAPILSLSLAAMRDRLQAVPSIREAAVERTLPDALFVRIVERQPVALWQNQNTLSLVDDQGVIMQGLDITPYRNLPLIVGEGAPKHVAELMGILGGSPEIARQFASAIRVGDRRWNIRLHGDVELKLPEDNAASALARLEGMDKEDNILERDIKVIDLRVPDRVFIKLSPAIGAPAANATNAKDI
jgi:cell division protein FtsQ